MKLFGVMLSIMVLCSSVSCGESDTKVDPGNIVVANSGCVSRAPGIKAADAFQSNKTYVSYEYAGKTLTLKHVNAAFNCCPASITAHATVSAAAILITEEEDISEKACKCKCLYDLDLKVENVERGAYSVSVTEPYLAGTDRAINFSVDLDKQTIGVFEVERTKYPWGI